MDSKHVKLIVLALGLALTIWVIWYANTIFLIAFSAILLAIFLTAVGNGTKKITRLPYPLALLIGIVVILGLLTLTFWLYSPLIAEQFTLLMKELPAAASTLRKNLTPYLGQDFLSYEKLYQEFAFTNQKLITQAFSIFSSTIGSVAGFIVFIIVGLYLAVDPARYVKWVIFVAPVKEREKVALLIEKIGQSLRWWILGKLLSMGVVGVTTFIGLLILQVNLAFILGFLSALLTFIPYVGAILSAIPAIMIAFAQSPLKAIYVTILYTGIHMLDGYLITPSIEQRTVSIPPALSILAQGLMVVLVGALGLALATPLLVVALALVHYTSAKPKKSLKIAKQAHNANDH